MTGEGEKCSLEWIVGLVLAWVAVAPGLARAEPESSAPPSDEAFLLQSAVDLSRGGFGFLPLFSPVSVAPLVRAAADRPTLGGFGLGWTVLRAGLAASRASLGDLQLRHLVGAGPGRWIFAGSLFDLDVQYLCRDPDRGLRFVWPLLEELAVSAPCAPDSPDYLECLERPGGSEAGGACAGREWLGYSLTLVDAAIRPADRHLAFRWAEADLVFNLLGTGRTERVQALHGLVKLGASLDWVDPGRVSAPRPEEGDQTMVRGHLSTRFTATAGSWGRFVLSGAWRPRIGRGPDQLVEGRTEWTVYAAPTRWLLLAVSARVEATHASQAALTFSRSHDPRSDGSVTGGLWLRLYDHAPASTRPSGRGSRKR